MKTIGWERRKLLTKDINLCFSTSFFLATRIFVLNENILKKGKKIPKEWRRILGEWELKTKIKYFVFLEYDAFEIKKGGKRVEFAFKLSLTFDPYFFPLKLYVFCGICTFCEYFWNPIPMTSRWSSQIFSRVENISQFFFLIQKWWRQKKRREKRNNVKNNPRVVHCF